uniref:hypothetical protein n=1 Tax=Pseudomonas syringae TaxID=317 RepID=UPI0010717B75|nr:hypothetical protein [Pseudomonas syringae]
MYILTPHSGRFPLGGITAGKQMFGVNPHHYWLSAHDGNFGGSGLQPLYVLGKAGPVDPKPKTDWEAMVG